ncbi:MAG TPA: ATP-binding protein, partial [Kiloniellales bacterium]|nr:ATP-binding protein [Kiloniellales bacterium]
SQLFMPFISTKAKGMGIGLAICRSIVDAHHGQIRAEPAEGGGTSFLVTLPAMTKQANLDE